MERISLISLVYALICEFSLLIILEHITAELRVGGKNSPQAKQTDVGMRKTGYGIEEEGCLAEKNEQFCLLPLHYDLEVVSSVASFSFAACGYQYPPFSFSPSQPVANLCCFCPCLLS